MNDGREALNPEYKAWVKSCTSSELDEHVWCYAGMAYKGEISGGWLPNELRARLAYALRQQITRYPDCEIDPWVPTEPW
jgi:hypothetical protein